MSCMHEILCNRIEDNTNTCMVTQASISHAINRSNHTILPTRWFIFEYTWISISELSRTQFN